MKNTNFDYQNYRDDLAETLKAETEKGERKEILKNEKNTSKYKASKLLRDEGKSESITEGKEIREKVVEQNIATLKELETKILDLQAGIKDNKISLKKIEAEYKNKYKNKTLEEYKNLDSGGKEIFNMGNQVMGTRIKDSREFNLIAENSIPIIENIVLFLKDHLEEINKKAFRISLNNEGRLEVHSPGDVNGVKHTNIISLSFPLRISVEQIKHELSYFLISVEEALKNTRDDIPAHKILKEYVPAN